MIHLADNGEPVTACRHECRFCGGLVLVCHNHYIVMHAEPQCLPFARAMAQMGHLPAGLQNAIVINVNRQCDRSMLN